MTFETYQVHLYAHSEPAAGCVWCGPWWLLRAVEIKDPRR